MKEIESVLSDDWRGNCAERGIVEIWDCGISWVKEGMGLIAFNLIVFTVIFKYSCVFERGK